MNYSNQFNTSNQVNQPNQFNTPNQVNQLNQSAVHVNPRHGIYAYIKDEYLVEEGDICFGEKEKNEKQDYMLIILTKLSYNIIYRFFELIFYQDAKDKGMDVKYNKESGLIKIAKKTEDIIDELLAELKKNSE